MPEDKLNTFFAYLILALIIIVMASMWAHKLTQPHFYAGYTYGEYHGK